MEVEVKTVISKTFVYESKEERDLAVSRLESEGYTVIKCGFQSYDAKKLKGIPSLVGGKLYPYVEVSMEAEN